ncbi:glutamate receptor ionotropic, delta-2-like [Macrobrachium nipponense]|uniref:glutamate receptor ionotropic, delta-2-like n=1 Tax=Macrobrachium nipponense TaxID=159736 RepID=UPI0030C8CD52
MRLKTYFIQMALVVNVYALRNSRTLRFSGYRDSDFTSDTGRNVSSSDVLSVILTISNISQQFLHIVYDQEYAEAVAGMTQPLSSASIGLMTLRYDGQLRRLTQMLDFIRHHPSLLVLLCPPVHVVHIFRTIKENNIRPFGVTWLVVMEGGDVEIAVLKLEGFILEGSRIQVLWKDPEGLFHLFFPRVDTYGFVRFHKRGKGSLQEMGNFWKQDAIPKRYSLSGRRMRVACKDVWPVVVIGETHPDGSVELVSGFEVALLESLSSYLNFTFSAVLSPDNAWGNLQSDGTVTGIVGMVARQEADFAISTVTITEGRESVVDFTLPYGFTALGLASRVPRIKNRAIAVLSPFTPQVWLYITISILLMGPVVYAHSYLMNKSLPAVAMLGLQWISFNMFRNIVVQGNFIQTTFWSQRCVLFFWYCYCLVISALYSGMLTAVLAIPSYETPIDSLEDLPRAVKDGFVVGVMGDTSNEDVFKVATDGIFKQTWELFDHKDRSRSFVSGPVIGMKRAITEKFVFIISEGFATSIAKKMGASRKFYFGRETFLPLRIGLPCRTGAPYLESFSRAILRMVEGGLLSKWEVDEYGKFAEERTDKDGETNTVVITIVHIQAAFYVLLLGICLAVIVLVIENIWNARIV